MPNLVKKFRVEVGFLSGGKKPLVTRTQISPAEDRVKTMNICIHKYIVLKAVVHCRTLLSFVKL